MIDAASKSLLEADLKDLQVQGLFLLDPQGVYRPTSRMQTVFDVYDLARAEGLADAR